MDRRRERMRSATKVRMPENLPPAPEIVYEESGWQVCTVRSGGLGEIDLPHMAFYVDQATQRTYVTEETWETLSWDEEATGEFLLDMRGGAGLKFIVTDAGPYARALRAESDAKPASSSDPLADLASEAHSLLVQAAGLNREPSPMQLQIFATRLAQLESRYAEQAQRLAQIREVINLAGVAVADA